ncbi:hypothetical protein [Pseudotabrizicola sp.]|uniref:hypothetical protein n=1 Tax=Pseudotabrizicola sp. TaxID=2939647 RepID=UPI00351D5956
MPPDGLGSQILWVAADLGHRRQAFQNKIILPFDHKRQVRLANIIKREICVKPPDERADANFQILALQPFCDQRGHGSHRHGLNIARQIIHYADIAEPDA